MLVLSILIFHLIVLKNVLLKVPFLNLLLSFHDCFCELLVFHSALSVNYYSKDPNSYSEYNTGVVGIGYFTSSQGANKICLKKLSLKIT